MKFVVAIDAPSRYSRPPFGRFAYVQSQGRLVWRKETAESAERLAELTNEALVFLRGMSGQYKLGIYPWKDEPEAAPEIPEDAPPPAQPVEQPLLQGELAKKVFKRKP